MNNDKLNRKRVIAVALMHLALLLNASDAPAQRAKPPRPQAAAPVSVKSGKLIVRVNGFRNSKGAAIALVYADKKGWDADKHMRAAGGEIKNGAATITFEDLPPGTYAVFAFHDENENDDLDMNWLGVPKEGAGTSNNHKLDRQPRFEEIAFDFGGGEKPIEIKLKYW